MFSVIRPLYGVRGASGPCLVEAPLGPGDAASGADLSRRGGASGRGRQRSGSPERAQERRPAD
ncbi:MAG: hypothetical protein LBQ12_05655 [Deltaproteobacteria bacterium]|nr:hypothetical protein [Deltaproteobacteria bacterium]